MVDLKMGNEFGQGEFVRSGERIGFSRYHAGVKFEQKHLFAMKKFAAKDNPAPLKGSLLESYSEEMNVSYDPARAY